MDLRRTKEMGSGENYITRNFVIYFSPHTIRMIRRRRMRMVGDVACRETGEERTRFWWENVRERGNVEDLGVDDRKSIGI